MVGRHTAFSESTTCHQINTEEPEIHPQLFKIVTQLRNLRDIQLAPQSGYPNRAFVGRRSRINVSKLPSNLSVIMLRCCSLNLPRVGATLTWLDRDITFGDGVLAGNHPRECSEFSPSAQYPGIPDP